MLQSGFFDLENRYTKLNERDPLIGLNEMIDWENFRYTLEKIRDKERKSQAGRKPYDVLVMFKVLVLQHLHNLSDDATEYQIRDRYSFCRFVGLSPQDTVPDAKTIWYFREQLIEADLIQSLFYDLDYQLDQQGYQIKKGQIVDASFVDVPRQRNTREENKQIKAGGIPERFTENKAVGSQKDTEARWAKKNQETHFGYKNHIMVDTQHKLIREYEITSAEVNDSNVFIELLRDNACKDVWADSAYRSEEHELMLKAMGFRSHVHKKGHKDKPLSERDQRTNKKKSRVRARVEHVFGSIENEQGGLCSRVIGLARNKAKIGLMNIVYNMRRLVTLHRIGASA